VKRSRTYGRTGLWCAACLLAAWGLRAAPAQALRPALAPPPNADQWRQLGDALSASGRPLPASRRYSGAGSPGIEARPPSDQRERPRQKVASHTAPAIFSVAFHTTNGDFILQVHRDWAPRGADRFYTLVTSGYYQGNAFFRVLPHFVAQWGLSPTPALSAAWNQRRLPDDPVRQSNLRGRVSFAASGPNSRTTQVFVNLANNPRLDKLGFAPFGEVTTGMATVETLAADYGDSPPGGHGPDPHRILTQGAAYLTSAFPRLDVIYTAVLQP